jgi:segregation and condensation protein B
MSIEISLLKQILECAILAAGEPVSIERLQQLFDEQEQPSTAEIREGLQALAEDCAERGLILKEVASGFTLQIKAEMQHWIGRLWEKRSPRYSRALLETLALIAYRQPITRSEIEEVRGVSIASTTFKILMEREWIRVVGHRDVPGKPALYATTKQFLDYFNLKTLSELPPLVDLQATLVSLQEDAVLPAVSTAESERIEEVIIEEASNDVEEIAA